MNKLKLVLALAVGATALMVGAIWAGGTAEADGGHSATASSDDMLEDPPSCPDAVTPEETGPNVVSYLDFPDSMPCWYTAVWGGGAVQVSRGGYTLKVTLPAGRWWGVVASAVYYDNPGGAFKILDATTLGWVHLNPADGAELDRFDCVDWLTWYNGNGPPVEECDLLEEGFPALLDAIAASATVPAAE